MVSWHLSPDYGLIASACYFRALLEADVSLPVVRRFVKNVEEKAFGIQVWLNSLLLSSESAVLAQTIIYQKKIFMEKFQLTSQ